MRTLRTVALVIVVAGLAGCFSKPGISINSTPEHARVFLNSYFIGTTPIVDYADPSSNEERTNGTLRIELDGYRPLELSIVVPLPDDLVAHFDMQREP